CRPPRWAGPRGPEGRGRDLAFPPPPWGSTWWPCWPRGVISRPCSCSARYARGGPTSPALAARAPEGGRGGERGPALPETGPLPTYPKPRGRPARQTTAPRGDHADEPPRRSEEHTSELQSRENLVCRLLLENNKN